MTAARLPLLTLCLVLTAWVRSQIARARSPCIQKQSFQAKSLMTTRFVLRPLRLTRCCLTTYRPFILCRKKSLKPPPLKISTRARSISVLAHLNMASSSVAIVSSWCVTTDTGVASQTGRRSHCASCLTTRLESRPCSQVMWMRSKTSQPPIWPRLKPTQIY